MLKVYRWAQTNKTKMLLIIFLIAILCRCFLPYLREVIVMHRNFVLFNSGFFKDLPQKSDDITYALTAKSLIDGHGFAFNRNEILWTGSDECVNEKNPVLINMNDGYFKHRYVPPLYPIFLAFCFAVFGANTLAYFVPQILLGSLTCILIYLIGRELFGTTTAVLAGMMVAFYPDLVFWTYHMRVETLFIFFLALAFLLLLKLMRYQKVAIALLAGITLGLACLTRLTVLFFILLIIVWILVAFNKDSKRKALLASVVLIFFSLTVLPWAIRNYFVFHEFTIMTDETIVLLLNYYHYTHILYSDWSDRSYVLIWLDQIIRDPFRFVAITLLQFVKYLGPFTAPMDGLAKIYKTISWLFVFPMAFWGLFLAAKNDSGKSSLLILFIIYYILLHSLSFVDNGLVYRYPIQPFLCIFAAHGFVYLLTIWRTRGRKGNTYV